MSASWAFACSTLARAAPRFFSCAFAALVARSASLGETVLRFNKSCWRFASSRKKTSCASCESASRMADSIWAAARSRRAFNSAASSSTIGWPARSRSPSWAKIFSTRPGARGPTCTSSTSIVPETALVRLWHAEIRIDSASKPAPRK